MAGNGAKSPPSLSLPLYSHALLPPISPLSNLGVDSVELYVNYSKLPSEWDVLSLDKVNCLGLITPLSIPFCSVTFSTFDILQDEEVGCVCLQVQWC